MNVYKYFFLCMNLSEREPRTYPIEDRCAGEKLRVIRARIRPMWTPCGLFHS
ncbi:unnamed protein product, partial [Nesidiocoris tenuis]